jgi:hypothetical protein
VQCHIHQRGVAAGGKITEVYDPAPSDLAADLTSLPMRSDVVLLVHTMIPYGGVTASGDRVLTQYAVQILRS